VHTEYQEKQASFHQPRTGHCFVSIDKDMCSFVSVTQPAYVVIVVCVCVPFLVCTHLEFSQSFHL